MILSSDVTAAVLAGGASARMGRDKALLPYRGATLLEAVARAVLPQCSGAMIIANDTEAYRRFGLPVFPDVIPGCGPLGGIHAAMRHAAMPGLLIVAADLPLITPDLTVRLLAAAEPGEVSIAWDGRDQPLFGVYPSALCDLLETLLRDGVRAVSAFLDACGAPLRRVDFSDAHECLVNVNTQEEYARLLRVHVGNV